jgi:hypothetical protein
MAADDNGMPVTETAVPHVDGRAKDDDREKTDPIAVQT